MQKTLVKFSIFFVLQTKKNQTKHWKISKAAAAQGVARLVRQFIDVDSVSISISISLLSSWLNVFHYHYYHHDWMSIDRFRVIDELFWHNSKSMSRKCCLSYHNTPTGIPMLVLSIDRYSIWLIWFVSFRFVCFSVENHLQLSAAQVKVKVL